MSHVTGQVCGVDEHGERGYVTPSGISTSYRYGYKIAGGPAVYVGYAAYSNEADREAQRAASKVAERVQEIPGCPSEVEWWTQKCTSEATVDYAEPQGGSI